MRANESVIMIVLLAIAAYILYVLFTGKGGIQSQAADAGKYVATNVINPVTTPALVAGTTVKAVMGGGCGATLETVPDAHGSEYVPNWTWRLPDGTAWGLPAGMTPREFCEQSPGSPICQQIGCV
jgi:hypothetical protein